MQYLITFLEGIITFISPCMLPMLPVYFSYFSGGEPGAKKALKNAVAFVAGFTVIFILLGLFAGTIGSFFTQHKRYLNIISGILLIIFGLNFLGILKVHHSHSSHHKISPSGSGFFSSLLMGLESLVHLTLMKSGLAKQEDIILELLANMAFKFKLF